MAEFRMPSLGADMEEGSVAAWNFKPGDPVKRGDIIAVVATEKADIDVEVYETGVLEKILVEPGQKVPVGTVLATIRAAGEEAEVPATPSAVAPEKEKAATATAPTPAEARPVVAAEAEHVRASPLARRLARELGIDLSMVDGTGEGGVIHRSDIERAAAQKEAEKLPTERPPTPPPAKPRVAGADQAGMRRAIAAAMARSNREIPHYYLETRIDMESALQWLEAENQKRSIKDRLLPAVLLIKAVGLALGDVPELNGYWIDDQLETKEAVHVGFATSLRRGGLVVPAIHNADLQSLDELMESLRDVITRTRAGRLRSSDLTDSTITVTNLGDLGVETVYGVIYPPQVALVGFGRVVEQPWAEGGMLGVRRVLTATLAADHRATDGHRGAQFLEALNRYLQEPTQL